MKVLPNNVFLLLLVNLVTFTRLHGYKSYIEEIPNGFRVPNPCTANTLWKAPGHEKILGGGKRNPFGRDFAARGHKWSVDLCQLDSDGDNKSNGEELGDPECTWTKGQILDSVINSLSHPGICEPLSDPHCKELNSWTVCEQIMEFKCDFNAVKEDNDVTSIDLKINETEVPDKETTYYCQSFELPDDGEYHIIGDEPLLDNEEVMHHMVLYGCEDADADKWRNHLTPGECTLMETIGCTQLLGAWTVGSAGTCHDGDYGFPIGRNGFKYAVLEFHWNNPLLKSGMTDSSGLRLHYTPNKRTHDLGVFFVSPDPFALSPGKEKIIEEKLCPSDCTRRMFKNEVNIVGAGNHMHYLGREGYLTQLRGGKVINELAIDREFYYDTPTTYHYNPPLVFKPGDELHMKCVYETTGKTETVYTGQGTQDEMCIGFFNYYPNNKDIFGCFKSGEFDTCAEATMEYGCNSTNLEESIKNKANEVYAHCHMESCAPKCLQLLLSWYGEEDCLNGEVKRQMTLFEMENHASLLPSLMKICEPDIAQLELLQTKRSNQLQNDAFMPTSNFILLSILPVLFSCLY